MKTSLKNGILSPNLKVDQSPYWRWLKATSAFAFLVVFPMGTGPWVSVNDYLRMELFTQTENDSSEPLVFQEADLNTFSSQFDTSLFQENLNLIGEVAEEPPRTPATFGSKAEFFLSDPKNRVSSEFDVPDSMVKRTAFWFDIYTKYNSNTHVIHHSRYPWIVFKVVDTSDIMNAEKGNRWTKYHKARRIVANEKRAVARALKKLAQRRSFSRLTGLEKEIYDSLAHLPGNRRRVFNFAAQNLRSQLGQKDFFLSGLKNSAKYLTYMEEEFRRMGLPADLTRMPFVESSFNENAESHVGASGIWQIMPATGKAYVRVNELIDERNSPLKATRVAAQMLRKYNMYFKSWPLTVTAYNHGIGSLQKAIRATRTKDLPTIIEKYHRGSFKFASSNFYACFLAALHAERYHNEIFEGHELSKEKLLVREILSLDRKLRVKEAAQLAGIDLETFKMFNLDLRGAIKKNAYLPKGFELHLPIGKKQLFFKRLAELNKNRRQAGVPGKKSPRG